MDKIRIRALQVEAVIGVYEYEQKKNQPLIFELCCHVDFSLASKTDCIDDTLDYDRCVQLINDFCRQKRFALLETLAKKLTQKIMNAFPIILSLELKIEKPQARKDAVVSVECEAKR